MRAALRWIRDVVITVGVCVVCAIIVFAVLMMADENWFIGLFTTNLYAGATYQGVSILRSRQLKGPFHQGVAVACLTATCAIGVAASMSFLLLRVGWAIYDPTPPQDIPQAFGNLATYFVWVLLDMLPGLQATDLLSFHRPLEPRNVVAGIPVIAFRVFVLFGLLAALKVWWKGRQNQTLDDSA